jgi:replicative superfamily II helicase
MRSSDAHIAGYLAPTRALVAEIENNLLSLLGNNRGIEISSLPLREEYDAARADKGWLILVFAQERLHFLANIRSDTFTIDMLIVDEAHRSRKFAVRPL